MDARLCGIEIEIATGVCPLQKGWLSRVLNGCADLYDEGATVTGVYPAAVGKCAFRFLIEAIEPCDLIQRWRAIAEICKVAIWAEFGEPL